MGGAAEVVSEEGFGRHAVVRVERARDEIGAGSGLEREQGGKGV